MHFLFITIILILIFAFIITIVTTTTNIIIFIHSDYNKKFSYNKNLIIINIPSHPRSKRFFHAFFSKNQ